MIKLLDVLKDQYHFMTIGVPVIKPDIYQIKNYYIFDNEKFRKVVYFDTDKGYFMSKSRTLLGSLYGIIGKIIDDAVSRNETIEVEIVNKRNVTGSYGLAFRTN